ncbi:MAG TPA: alpha/beta fold hydrolase [Acidimicrobiales bacterium]|nr:alpha/beta fold hydrolase [Acidimicrobiales bacterium]
MPKADTYVVGALSTALKRPETYVGHLREALNLARAAVSYPKGIFESSITPGSPCDDGLHDTPVVLVHGYGHNRSAWLVLERHLRKAGFTSVHTVNYNPLAHDVPELAARLKGRIDLIRALTGSPKVHVVGHSLGGVILRWYVQELGGDSVVDTAVSVASPHQGTIAAVAGAAFGRTAKQLLPGSEIMRALGPSVARGSVRWVAYYSNIDLLIQPSPSAKLHGATNVLVKDRGHLSMLLSPVVARSITTQLEAAEGAGAVVKPLHHAA